MDDHDVFLVRLKATPTTASAGTDNVKGADVLVGVVAADAAAAEVMARSHVLDGGWIVDSIVQVRRFDPSRLLQPLESDTAGERTCRIAASEGIASLFSAYPIVEPADDLTFEILSFPAPSPQDKRGH